jgi:hypothetical protein
MHSLLIESTSMQSITSYTHAPPQELWNNFQQTFKVGRSRCSRSDMYHNTITLQDLHDTTMKLAEAARLKDEEIAKLKVRCYSLSLLDGLLHMVSVCAGRGGGSSSLVCTRYVSNSVVGTGTQMLHFAQLFHKVPHSACRVVIHELHICPWALEAGPATHCSERTRYHTSLRELRTEGCSFLAALLHEVGKARMYVRSYPMNAYTQFYN